MLGVPKKAQSPSFRRNSATAVRLRLPIWPSLCQGSRGRGSGKANLWEKWTTYKDVAHLVTAATIISADAHERAKTKPFAELGLASHQLQPLLLTLLLPDFALSVALFLQNYGFTNVPHAREEPMLDPETLWRISDDMNVSPIAPPVRKINSQGIAVLNARRAGNRGKSKFLKTTSVLG